MGRHRKAPRTARLVAALASIAALAALGSALPAAGVRPAALPSPPATGPATASGPATGTPANGTPANAALAGDDRALAVRDLLRTRADAVRTKNRAAFLGTVDPTQTGFRRRQAALFDAVAQLPLAGWTYDLDATEDHAADLPLPRHYAAPAWAPDVTLRYRIAGFDPQPTEVAQFPTFVQRRGHWYLAADDDFAPAYQTRREIWDVGPIEVVRGARSIVVGHRGHHDFLASMAHHADAAVPVVTGVWGRDWVQRVVVVVPEDEQEMKDLLRDDTDLSQIAAVAVAELPDAPEGYRPVGNRILVNRPNFGKLGRLGRQVVFNHEVTHVACRDASGGVVPTWLVEGLADYVGYRDSGLRVRTAARELAADLRTGRTPVALPRDGDFRGSNPGLAQAYEQAWLAARMIAGRIGERGLVGFYRALGRAPAADKAAFSTTLRTMLRMTPQTFTQVWLSYLRQQLL